MSAGTYTDADWRRFREIEDEFARIRLGESFAVLSKADDAKLQQQYPQLYRALKRVAVRRPSGYRLQRRDPQP